MQGLGDQESTADGSGMLCCKPAAHVKPEQGQRALGLSHTFSCSVQLNLHMMWNSSLACVVVESCAPTGEIIFLRSHDLKLRS